MKKPSQKVLDKASFYQWIIKGRYFNLSEMDRGQLMQALMDTLDVLESIENKAADVSDILEKWRDGAPNHWDT